MRADHLLASTGLRLSLIYAGLVIASFALAIALTWLAARSAAESDLRARIRLESEAMSAEIRDEGIAAAVAAIEVRAERPGALEYWLEDRAGKPLSGDLPLMTTADGWHRIELPKATPGAENREEMLVLTATLADGSRLSVGDDLRRAEAVRDAVLRALLWIGVGTVVLGLGAGLVATRRSLRQVDALTATMSEVSAGRLDARFTPRANRPANDLDQLGLSVNRMLDHIDGLVRSLRRVSSDVAHDLRTPLAHVQQRLEQARTADTPGGCLRAIEAAENKVGEVLRAFDAILRLAEIEAGAARSRFVAVDAAALVERLADAYRPDVEASGRTLATVAAMNLWIRGDEELLAQALANLIENAMRHTPPGTHISLSAAADGPAVRLEVSDNGCGVPAQHHPEVLQPFLQLDSSRGPSGLGPGPGSAPGFGLGLSIVAAIVRLHDAALELGDAAPGLRVILTFAGITGPAATVKSQDKFAAR